MSTARSYWDYLHLDRLLSAQQGFEADEQAICADEMHFIVVHQVFELWFKLLLQEIRLACRHLSGPRVSEEEVPHVVHHLRRASVILKHASAQFEIMETLAPQDFLSFRAKLIPASGFQSFQLRELEILLGIEGVERPKLGGGDVLAPLRRLAAQSEAGAAVWRRIEAVRLEPTLLAALRAWLSRTPIAASRPGALDDDAVVRRFLDEYLAAYQGLIADQTARILESLGESVDAEAQMSKTMAVARSFVFAEDLPDSERPSATRLRAAALFIETYRELPLLSWPRMLLDTVLELEEHLVIFRQRHARMVERVIGRRMGTGGSSGVDYLDATASVRIFTDLWTVRTLLVPARIRPAMPDAQFYGFTRPHGPS